MRKLQNTLYVTTPMAYLSLDGETIVIQNEDECLGRVPLLNLENIVSFGYRGASPRLMGACAERGIGLCFLTQHAGFWRVFPGPLAAMCCFALRNIASPAPKMARCPSPRCS